MASCDAASNICWQALLDGDPAFGDALLPRLMSVVFCLPHPAVRHPIVPWLHTGVDLAVFEHRMVVPVHRYLARRLKQQRRAAGVGGSGRNKGVEEMVVASAQALAVLFAANQRQGAGGAGAGAAGAGGEGKGGAVAVAAGGAGAATREAADGGGGGGGADGWISVSGGGGGGWGRGVASRVRVLQPRAEQPYRQGQVNTACTSFAIFQRLVSGGTVIP
jgi:hypothetical protein